MEKLGNEFVTKYIVNGMTFWDNNFSRNYGRAACTPISAEP